MRVLAHCVKADRAGELGGGADHEQRMPSGVEVHKDDIDLDVVPWLVGVVSGCRAFGGAVQRTVGEGARLQAYPGFQERALNANRFARARCRWAWLRFAEIFECAVLRGRG